MIRVVYELDEGGVWYVYAPDIQGCHSYGHTIEEARSNIREAIDACDGDAEAELQESIVPRPL